MNHYRRLTAFVLVCLLGVVAVASAQTSQRLYVVPKVGTGTTSDPMRAKYFADTPGLSFETLDYGPEPVMIVCAQVTAAQHTTITANIDVTSVPLVLDDAMTLAGLAAVTPKLEGIHVPLDDFVQTNTYRDVVRRSVRVFVLMQQLNGFLSRNGGNVAASFFANGLSLDDPLSAALRRVDLTNAAQALGLDTSGIRATTLIRDVLKIADQLPPFTMCGVTF